MSHATLEEVFEKAEALPPNERQLLREVLKKEETSALFVILLVIGLLYLLKKTHSSIPEPLREALDRAAADSGLASRAEAVRAMRGKYAHLSTGREEFAALKRQEVELEDRR